MVFLFQTNCTRILTGSELDEALQKLRCQQRSGSARQREEVNHATVPCYVVEPRQVGLISPIILIEPDNSPDVTPASSVCQVAPTDSDIRESPSMPVFLPQQPLNFSAAQWGLPSDSLSVSSSDIDLTAFDIASSHSVSAAAFSTSLPPVLEPEFQSVPPAGLNSEATVASSSLPIVHDASSGSLLPYVRGVFV